MACAKILRLVAEIIKSFPLIYYITRYILSYEIIEPQQ